MEMTNRRWLAITVIACGLLAVLRLPPHGRPPATWSRARPLPETEAAAKLHRRIRDLNEALGLLVWRDRMLVAARSASGRTAPLVVASTRLTSDERQAIDDAVAAQARLVGAGASSLVLGVVMDSTGATPTQVNYDTERRFLLPGATDGESCVTLLKIGRGRRKLVPSQLQGIFGPCAFYAAFGQPGAGVESWLRRRAFDVAANGNISSRPDADSSLLRELQATRDQDLRRWLDFSRAYYRSLDVSACAGGNVEFCEQALQQRSGTSPGLIPDVTFRESPFWMRDLQLGDLSTLLGDLLADQGRERFQKFWQSQANFETAFESTFGETAGHWTMRWVQHRYGKDTRGPFISSRSVLASLIASLAFVGISASLAYRREAD